jgi:hypothetical protein
VKRWIADLDSEDKGVRRGARAALQDAGPAASAKVVGALRQAGVDRRGRFLEVLSELGPWGAGAIPELKGAVLHEDITVRAAPLRGLISMGAWARPALPELRSLLKRTAELNDDGTHEKLSPGLIGAIAGTGPNGWLDLVGALSHPSEARADDVVLYLQEAFGEGASALAKNLGDENGRIRSAAARVFCYLDSDNPAFESAESPIRTILPALRKSVSGLPAEQRKCVEKFLGELASHGIR